MFEAESQQPGNFSLDVQDRMGGVQLLLQPSHFRLELVSQGVALGGLPTAFARGQALKRSRRALRHRQMGAYSPSRRSSRAGLRAALCLLQNPQSILRGELAPLRLGHDLRVRRWPRDWLRPRGPRRASTPRAGASISCNVIDSLSAVSPPPVIPRGAGVSGGWQRGNEANVACRQLGFVGAVDDMGRTRDGQGRSLPPLYFGAPDEGVTMWLDNVMCEGDETSLLDCPRHGNLAVGVHNCRPREAVGVRCTMTPLPPHVTGPASVWGLPALTVFPSQFDDDLQWDSIDVVLQYRAPVTVDTAGGTPALSLLIGNDRSVPDNNVLAQYVGGSESTRLLFRYPLPESFGSPGPVRVVRNSLHTRGGTIRGTIRFTGSDTDVPLAHGAAAVTPFIVRAPAMELIDEDADDSFGDGDKVEATITFNEPVEVVTTGGTPSVALGADGIFDGRFASYVRGSGSTALVFSYTKAAADAETSNLATLQLFNLTVAESRARRPIWMPCLIF